jgi:hypothetical protein
MVSLPEFEAVALARSGKTMERARQRWAFSTTASDLCSRGQAANSDDLRTQAGRARRVFTERLSCRSASSRSTDVDNSFGHRQPDDCASQGAAAVGSLPWQFGSRIEPVWLRQVRQHQQILAMTLSCFSCSVTVAGTRIRLGSDVQLTDGRIGQLAAIALLEDSADFVVEVRFYDDGKSRELTLTTERKDCSVDAIAGTAAVYSKAKYDALPRGERRTAYWCEFYRDSQRAHKPVAAAPQLLSRQFAPPPDPPAGAKVVKLCLDLYCDFYPALSRYSSRPGCTLSLLCCAQKSAQCGRRVPAVAQFAAHGSTTGALHRTNCVDSA